MFWESLKSFILPRLPGKSTQVLRQMKIKILRVTKRDLDYFYDERFATGPFREKKWAPYFYNLILNKFHPSSVVDFGCGTGDILESFEKNGMEILGIDGSKACKKYCRIRSDRFLLYDLRNRLHLEKKYDLCLCIEVAEHIEEKYSDALISNLSSSSCLIIFTAAGLRQPGVDHCNLKPHQWWIEKFKKFGFVLDKESTEWLREELRGNPDIEKSLVKNWHIFKTR